MMYVPAARADIVKRSDAETYRIGESAHDQKSHKETDRRNEQTLAPRLAEMTAVMPAYARHESRIAHSIVPLEFVNVRQNRFGAALRIEETDSAIILLYNPK